MYVTKQLMYTPLTFLIRKKNNTMEVNGVYINCGYRHSSLKETHTGLEQFEGG